LDYNLFKGKHYFLAGINAATQLIGSLLFQHFKHTNCTTYDEKNVECVTGAARAACALLLAAALCAAAPAILTGCSAGGGAGAAGSAGASDTFAMPESITEANFHSTDATWQDNLAIDTAHVAAGWVAASAQTQGTAALKLQVVCNDFSYNYDLPRDGTSIVCPLNMGSGAYTFRIMQNTSANNYVEVMRTAAQVDLETEFAPYLAPNIYCNFDASSAVVTKARELAAGATDEADVLARVYDYITENVSYDTAKAAALANSTGYVPNPDETLAAGTGICFDYSALAGAMLRSLGLPCKVVTGYVEPADIYHSWNLVYINDEWVGVSVAVQANTWSIVDTTFAASAGTVTAEDSADYTQRYVY
jgi:hypothetical protein